MDVYVFGNPDLEQDSLPVRVVPQLQRVRPDCTFHLRDPLEDWDEVPDPLIIVDTLRGIENVQVITDLDAFVDAPRVGMHDLDLLAQLKLLKKVGKLKRVTVVGVPPSLTPDQAVTQIAAALPPA